MASMLQSVAGGLQKIVEASWVTSHQKRVVQALLQAQTAETDEDLAFQPQAPTAHRSHDGSFFLHDFSACRPEFFAMRERARAQRARAKREQ